MEHSTAPIEPFADPPPPVATRAPHEIWWTLLQGRIGNVLTRMPEWGGTIQFEVQRPEGHATGFFHLFVDGPTSAARTGLGHDADAWVKTTEAAIETFLKTKTFPADALEVIGDVKLVRRIFGALAEAPKAQGWISMQIPGEDQ